MPQNDNTTPTLREVIDGAIEERLLTVRTAMEAVVKRYDAQKQLVDAQPEIYLPIIQPDGTTKLEKPATIFNCPVGFPGIAGGVRITFPIPEGATGLLIFSESPIDEWMENGGETQPTSTRRHHLTDAMFIPVLKPNSAAFKDAEADALTMGYDGGTQVVVTKDEVQLGGNPSSAPTDFVALAPATKSELNKLHDAMKSGFDTLSTAITAISTHTHVFVGEGTVQASPELATLQTPSDPQDVGDVAASVTKAK
jgi:hypothetical protein